MGFQLSDFSWYPSSQRKSFVALPRPLNFRIWKERISPTATLSFWSCHCGLLQPSCLPASPGKSQSAICFPIRPTIPGGPFSLSELLAARFLVQCRSCEILHVRKSLPLDSTSLLLKDIHGYPSVDLGAQTT